MSRGIFKVEAARKLLIQDGGEIDPQLAEQLTQFVERADAYGRKEWLRVHGGVPPGTRAAKPVGGGTP